MTTSASNSHLQLRRGFWPNSGRA